MLRPGLLALLLLFGARPAAGMEPVSIPSLDGKLQLPGYLFEAVAAAPRPAVISLHGCGGLLNARGGLDRNRYRIAEYLNVEGMHMLALDSFTPRGVKSICEIPPRLRTLDYETRREDVYAAIGWLARRPNVDRSRIAVVGYSNGGSTVLSVLDRTDRLVKAQPILPRAAIAYYPGCQPFADMWSYELAAPLLLMIGALDDWTSPRHCERLHAKVGGFDLIVYPDSHHGFDGYGPVQARTGLPTRSGAATTGGNPHAREKSLRRMFEFLSAQLEVPLALSHEERLHGHRYAVPPASGFARIDDLVAVPLSEKGRARYQHYLGLAAPKAFAITEKGGWFFRAEDTEAMQAVLQLCAKAGSRCWLYAVDDRVVWTPDAASRLGSGRLQRSAPPTKSATAAPQLD